MTKKKCTKIYFRVFPEEKMKWDYVKILDDNKTVYIRSLQRLAKSQQHIIPTFWTFHTESVFYNHSQAKIYDTIIPDILDSISRNQDAFVMAYGQTGSGKSLTVNGLYNTFEERGILPRLVSDLFHNIKKRAAKNNINMCIQVSYVEFARGGVYDLLKSYPNHVVNLKDIIKRKVKTVEETLTLIFKGEGRKLFSESCSYASHLCSSVFTFYISTRHLDMQDDVVQKCKLHVVDLAGVDTAGNFTCFFKNPHEVGTANLAKTQLEQFFLILCTDIPEFINSKQRLNSMINYLGDSINKSSIFRVVGHIRVTRENLLVTISMLRFGELIGGLRATKYEMSITKHTHSAQSRLDTLEKELAKLKLENKHNSKFMQQDLAKSLNEERLAHIERTINEFLQNKISQVTLLNVCDVNIALEVLKMIFKKNEEERSVESVSVSKLKRTSSANINKTAPKLSKSAQQKPSEIKRRLDERARSSGGSMDLKSWNKDRAPSILDTARMKPKSSSSSLLKRSSTSRRRSGSSLSLTRSGSRSKAVNDTFVPEIPPEHREAWAVYIIEKSDSYSRLLDGYKKNEAAAKTAYRIYLSELEKLKEILTRVEKHKHDLLLAKMTRDFQHVDPNITGDEYSEFQKCCKEQLQKAEQEKVTSQDLVLKYQAELKIHINVCNDMKKDLNDSFNAFCKEKYHMPILKLNGDEAAMMNVLETLKQEEEKVEQKLITPENNESTTFENLKALIEPEKRKRKIYLMKHKEWITY